MKPTRACSVDGCDRPHEAKGYCHSHYAHWKRNPDAMLKPIVRRTALERFEPKIRRLSSGHWMWTGATASEGRYGAFYFEGKVIPAHRASWIMHNGPIPDGLVIDHECRKTLCVNPAHLKPKTQAENILIGDSPTAKNAAKTHCKRGHEFTPKNIRAMKSGGRACRACEREPEVMERRRESWRAYAKRRSHPAQKIV